MRPLTLPSRRPPRGLLASESPESLVALLVAAGGTPAAARKATAKLLRHVYQGGEAAYDEATLRRLGVGRWAHGALLDLDAAPSLELAERAPASDGSERLLLRARDGALVETVIIPGPNRTTLCLSSQVGCARACAFCETGRLGLARQLASGEMVDQVRLARDVLRSRGDAPPLRNLVFMGMGEPFDNLDQVVRAIDLLTSPWAFELSPSHVTVSTVGVVDKIDTFFASTRAELAVSLNAPDDARRGELMPINKRYPMATLKDALVRALPPGRRVLLEYVLFDGYNDALADADLVAEFTRGLRCRVNVIPSNPGPDPRLRPPSAEALDAFVGRLTQRGVTTLVRRPRGRDVGGACGQLSAAYADERATSTLA